MTLSRMAAIGRLLVAAQMPVASICLAQVAPPGFAAFKHVRAAADDGAPDGILRLAQTGDGYLWLAGDALYRFDGATFERIDWPARAGKRHASPSALMVGSQGELWVGLRDTGGVAVYRHGELRDMRLPDPPRGVGTLARTPDGTIWAGSSGADKRLHRLRGSRWERVDEALGLPPGYIMDLAVARDGGLWVSLSADDGASGRLAALAPGEARFRSRPVRLSGRPKIAFDRAGALWASDAFGTRLLFDAAGRPPATPIAVPPVAELTRAAFAFDRSGGIWGTTSSTGIFHIAEPRAPHHAARAAPDRFSAADGLTSDVTYAPFVDREDNVWIGTEGGIDQFRRASAVQEPRIPPDAAHGLALAAAGDGSLYVASKRTLFRILPGAPPEPLLTLSADDVSLCAAHDGGVWALESGRTWRVRGATTLRLPPYPGGGARIACVEDNRRRLWLGLIDGTLLWRDAGGWHRATGALADLELWDLATTPAGELAIVTPPDVAILRGDRLQSIRLAATGVGTPWAMMPATAPGSRDIFVSGSGGLVRIRGETLRHLDERRFPWITWVRTLQQTASGETWLFSRTGAYRVATAALDRAFDDPRAPLPYTRFDALDGLASTVQHGGFAGPQSALGGDGRLWFLNRQGAAYLEPNRLEPNRLAPPVTIRALSSGGRTWRDPAGLVLPAGTRTIDLAYAGLSFTVPQRVRFRYRLDGVDDRWVDAGARRVASYSNLGPGNYRFQVIAMNNDGVWNRAGATLDFEIRPTFVQSWPFRLLCVALFLALLWFAYSVRLRAVARGIRLRMAERVEERERIARELHDTLLQSIQALTLRFQLAADDLPPRAKARASLVEAIDTADRVIAEGRDRVRELRSLQEADIEQIICDVVARTAFPPTVDVSISSSGSARRLSPPAVEEITRIAGEALFNVRRHADATRVIIDIAHGASFELGIVDNGVGIEPGIAAGGGKPGHFGLVGMAERARRLRGRLVVGRGSAGGTAVRLTVPASIAYNAVERGPLARLWSP